MTWLPPAAPVPAPSPGPGGTRRRSPLLLAGLVIAAIGLVVLVLGVAQLLTGVGSNFTGPFTAPALSAPLSRPMSLDRGDYTVFELTGRTTAGSGAHDGEPTLMARDIRVTGPDGRVIDTQDSDTWDTVDRGTAVYTAAVTFTVPTAGQYQVTIDNGEDLTVLVAPSFGSGRTDLHRPALVALGGVGVLLVGVVLAVVGLVRRSPRPPAMTATGTPWAAPAGGSPWAAPDTGTGGPGAPGTPTTGWPGTTALPAPGWYPDPQAPQQWRYWTGREWAAPTAPPPAASGDAAPPAGPVPPN